MRKKAGLNQHELAAAVGATQPAISQLENGSRPLTIEWMRSLARAMKCSPADILDDDDNPDRLDDDERLLVQRYRSADERERETILRVTQAVAPDRDRQLDAA